MAEIIEDHKSRAITLNASCGSATYVYTLKGYEDEDAAMAALINESPNSVSVQGVNLLRDEASITPIVIGDNSDTTIFQGRQTYGSQEVKSLVDSSDDTGLLSADFNERQEDILNAIDCIHVDWDYSIDSWQYADQFSLLSSNQIKRSPLLSNFGLSINKYAFDQPALGTSRNVPASTFSIERVFSADEVSNSWFKTRMDMVWSLNAYTYRGLPPRTVAFTGFTSQQRVDGSWNMTFSFEYRPFVTYYIYRDNIPFSVKTSDKSPFADAGVPEDEHPLYNGTSNSFQFSAWDYLWFRDRETSTGDVKVEGFTVSRLYPNANFNLIGV